MTGPEIPPQRRGGASLKLADFCKARYEKLRDGTFYGQVPRLRGVLATGASLEDCRDQLAEVVEEWVLVRVARGLSVPPLGKVVVRVKQAN